MKNTIQLENVDKRTICSYADFPIMEFYKGFFESVFVSLNPFMKLNESSEYSTENFWNEEINIEDKKKITENTTLLEWKNISEKSKLKDINEIDIALRNSILGLNKVAENKNYLKILNDFLESNNILPPNEGYIPEIQQNELLKSIQNLGYEKICIGSEFGEQMEIQEIIKIIESDKGIYQRNLYTEDKRILITVHWDSFQIYICSSRKNVGKIVKEANLEGFYCDLKTEIYWSLR